METKNTINQRFKDAVNYLITVKSVKNKTELSKNLRLSKPKFSEILNNRMNVGIDTVALFCLLYEIRVEWLLTGKGKMVRPNEFIPESEELKKIYNENIHIEVFENEINYKELSEAKSKIITMLEKDNERLEKELQEQKQSIEQLKKELSLASSNKVGVKSDG